MHTVVVCRGAIHYYVASLPTHPQQSQALLPEETK
nr:MAG TPA: hypothetical protein [Caudoviricetes sp.]